MRWRALSGALLIVSSVQAVADAGAEGWYFHSAAGYLGVQETRLDTSLGTLGTEFEPGYFVGGGLGYAFRPTSAKLAVRLETEVGFRRASVDSHSLGGVDVGIDENEDKIETDIFTAMFNLLLEYPLGRRVDAHLGAGLGVAHVDFDNFKPPGVEILFDEEDDEIAWQLLAGVGFAVSRRLTLTAQYRYLTMTETNFRARPSGGRVDTGGESDSHAFSLGLRYWLGTGALPR